MTPGTTGPSHFQAWIYTKSKAQKSVCQVVFYFNFVLINGKNIPVVFILIFNLCFFNHYVNAQNCSVRGKVIDMTTKEPMAYSHAVLIAEKDSGIVDGAVADGNGIFKIDQLKAGTYHAKVSFIGYQPVLIKDISVQPGVRDLGEIELQVMAENLNEIMIRNTDPALTYKVDRKVIDAGSFPGAEVAMDLLENIPSVQLDFEGKLTYRGEGTFKVYINGHPVANGEEKLQQLPANQIDKIEIITNPSAKYHAEGTAGIIQIILKKNRLEGYAISSNIKMNSKNGYDYNFSVDNKRKKSGWYMQGQWSRYVWAHYKSNENQLTSDNDLAYETEAGKSGKRYKDYSYFESGFNYDISDKDYINFSGYMYPGTAKQVYRERGHVSEKVTDKNGLTTSADYKLDSRVDMNFQYVGTTFTWDHAFNKKRTHKLSAYMDYSGYLQDLNDQQIDIKAYDTYNESTGYKGSEQNEIVIEGKLNYTLPVNEKTSFEVGVQINTDHIPKLTSVSGTFDEAGNITKFEDEPLNQSVNFEQDIYAAYLSLKKEWNKLAVQLGMRAEYTERRSDYSYDISENEQKTIPARRNFTDFFPSAHMTYSLSKTHQLYISYSRRIIRPNYWSLIPLEQYESPYSVYKGNGKLHPSFTNACEAGYKKSWDKDFISTEIFFRQTDHVIQNYSRTRSENRLVRSPENVGKSSSLGAEFMTGVDILPWWNVNVSTNLFLYQLDIDFENLHEKIEQVKSNSRLNSTFRLSGSCTLKWDLSYNSPVVKAQTKRDGYFVSNLAIKKTFPKNRWNTTLVFNDLFSGERYDETTTGIDFMIKTWRKERPYISFTVGYVLDNQNK